MGAGKFRRLSSVLGAIAWFGGQKLGDQQHAVRQSGAGVVPPSIAVDSQSLLCILCLPSKHSNEHHSLFSQRTKGRRSRPKGSVQLGREELAVMWPWCSWSPPPDLYGSALLTILLRRSGA